MSDEGSKRVVDLLEKLGGVTGQAIERLWPLTVKAVQIDAMVGVCAGLFAFGVAVFGFKALAKHFHGEGRRDDGGYICGVCGCVIAFVAGFFLVFCNLQGVFSPEGLTVLKIISAASK